MNSSHVKHKKKKAAIALFMVLALFSIGALVMLLWNALLPNLFEFPRISYWQALGLFALSRILFGSFKFGHDGRNKRWKHCDKHTSEHRDKEKLMSMTKEEKDVFIKEWKKREYE